MQKRKRANQKLRKLVSKSKPKTSRKPYLSRFTGSNRTSEIKTQDMNFTNIGLYLVDQLDPRALMINSTGVQQNIAAIQQGTSISQRVGNKILLKSVRIRLALVETSQAGSANNTSQPYRVMLVYDRQPTGIYRPVNNILSGIRQDGLQQNGTYSSNIDPNSLDRYVVLMDELKMTPTYNIAGITNVAVKQNGATDHREYVVDRYINLKNLETVFNTSTSPMVIANMQTGSLLLIVLGTTASGSEPYALQGTVRLRFYDP